MAEAVKKEEVKKKGIFSKIKESVDDKEEQLAFLSTIALLFFKALVLEECSNLAFLCKSEALKTCNLTNLPNKQKINSKLKI